MLCGDIYFKLMHKGSLKNKLICRFALNTSFIIDNWYEFSKNTVDPDSLIKDDRFSEDFKIDCYFRDFCNTCNSSIPLERLCIRCTNEMESEIKSWKIIRNIIDVLLLYINFIIILFILLSLSKIWRRSLY